MRSSLAAITVNLGGGVWRTVAWMYNSSPACFTTQTFTRINVIIATYWRVGMFYRPYTDSEPAPRRFSWVDFSYGSSHWTDIGHFGKKSFPVSKQSNLRQTTHKCVYFRSRDKDDGHNIRSVIGGTETSCCTQILRLCPL